MNNKIKRMVSGMLSLFSIAAFSSGVIGNSITASAAESGRYNARFVYKNVDGNGVPGMTFRLCEDKDGDGKFTKGVDDTSVYKVTSDEDGLVLFRGLRTGKTYFINQKSMNEKVGLFIDDSVYSFKLNASAAGKTINLLDYLPADTYLASPSVIAHFDYTTNRVEGNYYPVSDAVFAICPDRDGDGKFTKGIDDTEIITGISNERGGVYFENIACDKTYFITQVSALEAYVVDKNVYSFFINSRDGYSSRYHVDDHVDLLDYLPSGIYKAEFKVNAILSYETADGYEVGGTVFAICEDKDNDGKFTKGIDDTSIRKVSSSDNGLVVFDGLSTGKRYFITQISSPENVVLNKNVYSFTVKTNYYDTDKYVNINKYLPASATVAKLKK